MKIVCTVKELAMMVRNCENGNCMSCVMSGLCVDDKRIEGFVNAIDVVDEVETDE